MKKNKYIKYETMLKVRWIDASSNDDWIEFEEINKCLDAKACDKHDTIGYFIAQNQTWLLVADTIDRVSDALSNYTMIPQSCIVNIVELKVGSKQ